MFIQNFTASDIKHIPVCDQNHSDAHIKFVHIYSYPNHCNVLIEILCRRNSPIRFRCRHQIRGICRCIGVVLSGGAIPTVGRIPVVIAGSPRKHRLEAIEEVVKRPGDDDIVVSREQE